MAFPVELNNLRRIANRSLRQFLSHCKGEIISSVGSVINKNRIVKINKALKME